MFQIFIMINKPFTFKLFFPVTNLVLPAISGPAFLQISQYTTLLLEYKWATKTPTSRHRGIYVFHFRLGFRTRIFFTILAYTSVDVASARPASWLIDLTSLFLAKNCVCRFCFLHIVVTCKRLKYVTVRGLKFLCSIQLHGLKDRIIKVWI